MKVTRIRRVVCIAVFCVVGTVLMLAVGASTCLALKPGEISLVSEMHTGYCAIAAMDPDEKVRNPDYMAEKLLPPNFWVLSPLLPDYKRARAFIAAYRVSRYYTANALTRHIDGILLTMGDNGLKQVVNIGAGFDSRPYRFGKQMPGVHFFEIDQPAMLDAKIKRVKEVVGGLPHSVTYIPIDNRSQPVFDALKRAGYQENLKTLFIWECAAGFTESDVANQTLRSIGKHAAAGSEVVFDYIVDEVVRGDFSRYRGAYFSAVRLTANGEPWKFGIPEDEVEDFVSQRGLKLISDLGDKELTKNYLIRSNGKPDGHPTPWRRVIHASVGR